MKNVYSLILTIFILLFGYGFVQAQCATGSQLGTIAPITVYQTVSVPAGAPAYYSFWAEAGATYTFTYCAGGGSAAYDTYLTITDNTPAVITFNDDFCGLQSQVSFTPGATGIYRIYASQWPTCTSRSGAATLAYIRTGGGPKVDFPLVAICGGTVTHSSTTVGAGDDCNISGVGSQDRTYGVVIPQAGTYTINTCTAGAYDTRIVTTSGNCTGLLANNDDFCGLQSQVTYNAAGPGILYVIVEGFNSGSSGTYTLSVIGPACGPPFNPCTSIPNISACGVPSTYNIPVGSGAGWSPGNCGFATPGQEQLYTFTAPTTGTYTLNQTAGSGGWRDYFFKPVAGGCSATGWTCILDMFGTGSANFSLTAGTQYYILVDPEGTTGVTGTFNIVCPTPPPANDDCSGAISLGTLACNASTSVSGATTNATIEASTPPTCGTTYSAPGVWYTIVGNGTNYTANLCTNNYDTKIHIYNGSCGAYTCVTGNDDFCGLGSQVTWAANSGTTYYILVSGFNTATGTFTLGVTSQDVTAPAITCPANINTTTNTGCTATGVSLGTPATSDNCGVTSLTNNHPSTTYPLGVTNVTWTAADAVGNSSTCIQSVTVTDNVNPTITCPANINTTTNSGCTATGVSLGTPTTGDNCSVGSVVNNYPSTTFPLGITIVIWTVTDGSGNTATCSQTVTVTDNVNPTISCPANIVQNNTLGQCGAVVTYASPTFGDNCSATLSQTTGLASGATFPVGTTTNTFVATDAAGNSAVCSFTVTVNDTESPAITCPANIVQGNSPGSCGANVTFTPTGADNCPGVTIMSSPASGSFFALGTTSVIVTATDAAGNSSTCSFTVTVNDTENPTITCPSNITTSNTPGTCSGVATYSMPTFGDNCPGTSITQIAGLPSGSTFPVGVTNNTFRVTDAAGNTNVCSFTVTVNDTESPIVTCPANITQPNTPGSCGANVSFTPTASDNCGATVVSSPVSGSFFPVGTTAVTVTATDAAGNSNTCTFTVTINDTQGPTISCAPNMNVNSSCTPVTVTPTPPTANDNCTGVVITNNHPSSSYPLGVTTIIWTATDANGNSATCSQTITVTSPEADVLGNGQPINNASIIISLTNWTDFGNVPVCSTTVTRTYVIKNTGNGTLNLTGLPKVYLTGLNVADFSVIQPLVSSLAPGASTSFQVTFDPSAAGYRYARVTIPNTDCNEGGYFYSIRGYGAACSGPALIPDPSGITQSSGNNNNEEGGSTMGVENNNEFGGLIYPNPSNGVFTLQLSQLPRENTEIRLVNNLGQVIYSGRLMVQTSYYDFSYLAAGTYHIQVTSPEVTFTKTIIITQKY